MPGGTAARAYYDLFIPVNALLQDLRYAARQLRQSPGFTAAAVVSLALGIGATTSVFSVAHALLLRPLPYRDAERLVILWNRSPGLNISEDWFSTAQYFDIKKGHSGFEQVAIAIGGNSNLTGTGEAERVGVIRVSSNLLPMLGVEAARGRLFTSAEDEPGQAPTALLSDGLWKRRYGGDPRVLNRSVVLNGKSYQVVGILPAGFGLPREVLPTLGGAERADFLLPLPLSPAAANDRGHEDYNIAGKLKAGVALPAAQAEMDTLTARLRRDHPEVYPANGGLTFRIVPLQEQVVGKVRRALYLLLGAVGLVLLIACANVASLLLARALSRRKEMAMRTALGAGRARLVRQLLTESVMLALYGGVLGVLAAMWAVNWIRVAGPKGVPRAADITVDGRVLLFTVAVSVLSGVLFGLAPALRASRLNLRSALQEAGRGAAGMNSLWGRGPNLRRLLVAAELALSVVLLIAAGLLMRSFAGLQSVDPGFNARRVLTFNLTMTGRPYEDPATVVRTYRRLWERLDGIPGVTASGGITGLPLTQTFEWTGITVEGRTPPAGESFLNADVHVVSGRYFEAMEIPLRRGRLFTEKDTAEAPRVALVDDFMARELWPGQEATGKRMRMVSVGPKERWLTVVGVVGQVKHEALDGGSRIAFYLPQSQYPARALSVVVKSRTGARTLLGAVTKAVREVDADLPLYYVRTMEERVGESLAQQRFTMLLLAGFAMLALALAAVGVYGVMAYQVDEGRREIGIRVALGATERGILRMVVRQGLALALGGVAAGLACALLLTHLMESLLFGVRATDPLTFATVPAVLFAVAVGASYVPARRAARLAPMASLRAE